MKYFIKILSWCGYIVILFALNVSFVRAANIDFIKTRAIYVLKIDGKIENGDFTKFMDKLSQVFVLCNADFQESLKKFKEEDPSAYKKRWTDKYGEPKDLARIKVLLNSAGGDIAEAMKIGRAVRDMLLSTQTGFFFHFRDKSQMALSSSLDTKCMSACFFVWVSGVDRTANFYKKGKNPLGIHRLYFNPEYYKGLSSDKAEIEYRKLKDGAKKYLQEMGVPDYYFVKMFNIPSNEVYILSKEEVENLEGKIPYYEEFLFSKCGSYTKQEKQDYDECLDLMPLIKNGTLQKADFLAIINKCEALSPGYLDYLESKINETKDCWRTHGDIELWKTMSKYFSKKTRGFE